MSLLDIIAEVISPESGANSPIRGEAEIRASKGFSPQSPLSPPTGPDVDNERVEHRWHVIEGDQVREVTVSPAMTHAEIERLYPAAVVRIDDRRPRAVATADLEEAMKWAPLIGERDRDLVSGFVAGGGLEPLRTMALTELLRDPPAVIASLTDQEAVGAAIAVLAYIHASEALRRALGPIEPAARARHGRLEHRAIHAREVLRLVASELAKHPVSDSPAIQPPQEPA